MGVIAGRADRVVVMYGGKKAEEATTIDLFRSMRHPYSQALLASMPNLENATKHELASIAGLPPDLSKEIVGCRFAPRCRFATDECRAVEPELTGTADHEYRCFHPVDGPQALVVRTETRAEVAAKVGSKELLRVEGLTKEFAVKAGLIRHKVGAIHAVSNVTRCV